jgi:hypothetical protein
LGVEPQLELELDRPAMSHERAGLALRQALGNVDMHGWTATVTADGCRVHLDGGSVSIDLALSANIVGYIQEGLAVQPIRHPTGQT